MYDFLTWLRVRVGNDIPMSLDSFISIRSRVISSQEQALRREMCFDLNDCNMELFQMERNNEKGVDI